ncbi:unnamed protein product [Urochloa humidicola]
MGEEGNHGYRSRGVSSSEEKISHGPYARACIRFQFSSICLLLMSFYTPGAFEEVHDLDDEEYDSDGHIDDGLDEIFSIPNILNSKYYKWYFRCPFCPTY